MENHGYTIVKPYTKSFREKKGSALLNPDAPFFGSYQASIIGLKPIKYGVGKNISIGNDKEMTQLGNPYNFINKKPESRYDEMATAHFREEDRRGYENARFENLGFVPILGSYRKINLKDAIEENKGKHIKGEIFDMSTQTYQEKGKKKVIDEYSSTAEEEVNDELWPSVKAQIRDEAREKFMPKTNIPSTPIQSTAAGPSSSPAPAYDYSKLTAAQLRELLKERAVTTDTIGRKITTRTLKPSLIETAKRTDPKK